MYASGVAAALGGAFTLGSGTWAATRLVVGAVLSRSLLCLAALAVPRSVGGYGALRFVQVLLITRIAQRATGQVIGVINSARIAAGFLGPVVATMMLAWGSASAVCMILAVVGLACVPLALARDTRPVSAF